MKQPPAGDQGASRVQDGVGEALTARVTVTEEGTVTGWNEGARQLLGHTSAQVVGGPAAVLLAEEPAVGDLPDLARLSRWHGRLALRHRDGHRVEVFVLAHHRTPAARSGAWLLLSPLTGQEPLPADDALVALSFRQPPSCAQAL